MSEDQGREQAPATEDLEREPEVQEVQQWLHMGAARDRYPSAETIEMVLSHAFRLEDERDEALRGHARTAANLRHVLASRERFLNERDWLLTTVRAAADNPDNDEAVRRWGRWALAMYEAEHGGVQ